MATLSQIESRIQKLQSQADALRRKKADAAIFDIRKIMVENELTLEDLQLRLSEPQHRRGRPAGSKNKESLATSAKVAKNIKFPKTKKLDGRKGPRPPMYRDPETGATWSGWARPPAWIKDVKDRSIFLINKPSGPAPAIAESQPRVKKAAGKAATKKSVVKSANKKSTTTAGSKTSKVAITRRAATTKGRANQALAPAEAT